MYLTGTEGDDILVGGAEDDTILGLGGDDLLIGGAGYDILDGGEGSDTVSYADADPVGPMSFLMINLLSQSVYAIGPTSSSVDKLVSIENAIGSAGVDWFVGTSGDNRFSGGAGNDRFEGKGGADVMDGGDGDDWIDTSGIFGPTAGGALMIGGAGNDQLRSGNSYDTMLGGAGNDTLYIENYAVTRTVDGGADTDTLVFVDSFTTFATGVFVDLNKAVNTVTPGLDLTITNVENVTGTNANDTLVGDGGANVLNGGAGNDMLYGGGGNDTLIGGDGEDYLYGGVGQDVLNGGAGADTFVFGFRDSMPTDFTGAGVDVIADWQSTDEIRFAGKGMSISFGTYAASSFAAAQATADWLLTTPGYNQLYMAFQVGADVYVFAGQTVDATAPALENVIKLAGASTADISISNFY